MRRHYSSIVLFLPLFKACDIAFNLNLFWLQWLNLMILPYVSYFSHFTFINNYSNHHIADRIDTSTITSISISQIFKNPYITCIAVLLQNCFYTKLQRDFWFLLGMIHNIYYIPTLFNVFITLILPITNILLRNYYCHLTQFIWHLNGAIFLCNYISIT